VRTPAIWLALAVGACASGDPPRPAPARSAEGLPVTGRAPYDAYFQQIRRIEVRAKELGARAQSLSGPVAIALELPVSAPTEDLAAALQKVAKRCARLGLGVRIVVSAGAATPAARLETTGDAPLPPHLSPGLGAAAAALTEALVLAPDLEDANSQGEGLRTEGQRLTQETPADFSKRGSVYARAVAREVSDAAQRLDSAVTSLREARDFTRTFLALLPDATAEATSGPRVPAITPAAPRLTTP